MPVFLGLRVLNRVGVASGVLRDRWTVPTPILTGVAAAVADRVAVAVEWTNSHIFVTATPSPTVTNLPSFSDEKPGSLSFAMGSQPVEGSVLSYAEGGAGRRNAKTISSMAEIPPQTHHAHRAPLAHMVPEKERSSVR